jgi:galactokinase
MMSRKPISRNVDRVSTPKSQTPDSDNQMAVRLVQLAMVRHVLRSRRFYERLAVVAIALAALKKMDQENRANLMARLVAWNERQIQRLERKAH